LCIFEGARTVDKLTLQPHYVAQLVLALRSAGSISDCDELRMGFCDSSLGFVVFVLHVQDLSEDAVAFGSLGEITTSQK
jgi:hypothetical protein